MGPFLMYEVFRDGELIEAGRLERGNVGNDALRHASAAMDAKKAGLSYWVIITDPDDEIPTINIGVDGAVRP